MNPSLSFNAFYYHFSKQMEKHGINMIRIALSVVFIWFGALKILGMSPAHELVEKTVYWFPPEIFIPFLGIWEVAMGFGLIFKRLIPYTIILLLLHMAGTLLPLFLLPDICFDAFPFARQWKGNISLRTLF